MSTRIAPDRLPRMTAEQLGAACALSRAILDDSTVSPARAEATRDELWRLIAEMHAPETQRYAPAVDGGAAFLLLAGRHGLLTPRQVAAAMSAEGDET